MIDEKQGGIPVEPPVPITHVLPSIVPVGTVVAYAGKVNNSISSPPNPIANIEIMGWMFCDGRALNITQYPELYSVIGTIYGGDKGGNTFNIPDYRGQFFRGHWLDRKGENSDKQDIKTASQEKRTTPPGGDKNGVGSTQEDAIQYHEHNYKYAMADKKSTEGAAAGSPAPKPMLTEDGPQSSQIPRVNVRISNYETRPKNVFVNYIIKFTSFLPEKESKG